MRARDFIDEVNIDNRDGWGNVPNNLNVDYLGLKVLMRPSTFLRLAAPLDEPGSSKAIADHIRSGGAIGAPFLDIKIPEEWFDGDFTKPAGVSGHEGRNRMTAVSEVEGDDPIEVHLFPRGGVRRRDLTDEIIAQLNKKLLPERGMQPAFPGPYFQLIQK
jgi:hypothetical protein